MTRTAVARAGRRRGRGIVKGAYDVKIFGAAQDPEPGVDAATDDADAAAAAALHDNLCSPLLVSQARASPHAHACVRDPHMRGARSALSPSPGSRPSG